MHEQGYTARSSFIPFIEQATHSISLGEEVYQEHPMLNQALYYLSKGLVSIEDVERTASFNLRTVTDNDPFFYEMTLTR